jgi:hypothetical protein
MSIFTHETKSKVSKENSKQHYCIDCDSTVVFFFFFGFYVEQHSKGLLRHQLDGGKMFTKENSTPHENVH